MSTTTTASTSDTLMALAQRMSLRACAQNVVDRETLADAETLAGIAQGMSDTPADAQANALLDRVQRNQGPSRVFKAPAGGLPDGYLLVIEGDNGFECGIAPDGRVSS